MAAGTLRHDSAAAGPHRRGHAAADTAADPLRLGRISVGRSLVARDRIGLPLPRAGPQLSTARLRTPPASHFRHPARRERTDTGRRLNAAMARVIGGDVARICRRGPTAARRTPAFAWMPPALEPGRGASGRRWRCGAGGRRVQVIHDRGLRTTTSRSCSSPPRRHHSARSARGSAAALGQNRRNLADCRRSASGMTLLRVHRPRPLLRGRRLLRRSLGRGRPRGHHPRARRPRAPGAAARYLTSATGVRVLRARLGPAAPHRRRRYGEPRGHQRRPRLAPSRRPHPRLGAGARRAPRRGLGRSRATTRPSPTRPARRSSRCAATPSSPSARSACRSTAGRRRQPVFAEIHAWWRANQDAGRASAPVRLRARQGAAAARRPRSRDRPDPHARRGRAAERGDYREPASRCRRPPTSATSDRADWQRAHLIVARPRPTARPGCAASAPRRPRSPRAGCAIRGTRRRRAVDRGFVALRPRRLARPARRDRRDRRRARLGDPRLHRRARALAAASTGCDAEALVDPVRRRARRRRSSRRRRGEPPPHESHSPSSTPRSTRPPARTRRSRALVRLLPQRRAADAAWAVYFLIGRRPKRLIGSAHAARLGDGRGRHSRLAVRGVLPRRRRPRRDDRPAAAPTPAASSDLPLLALGRAATAAAARARTRRSSARELVGAWRELGPPASGSSGTS